MKKLLLFTAGIFISATAMAQTSFGLTAGYTNIAVKSSYENLSASVSESGFYIGALADIAVSESFYLQPGVNYANVQETNMLYIPVTAKYYISNSQVNLQAGPQAAIILDEVGGGMNSFGLDLGFGAGYDITENFFLQARYYLEVTNRIKDFDIEGLSEEPKGRINTLQIGIGYKF